MVPGRRCDPSDGDREESAIAVLEALLRGGIGPEARGRDDGAIPQATDEEIARAARAWDDGDFTVADSGASDDWAPTEATDEAVAEAVPEG